MQTAAATEPTWSLMKLLAAEVSPAVSTNRSTALLIAPSSWPMREVSVAATSSSATPRRRASAASNSRSSDMAVLTS
jgi:hypothetical protein